MALREKKEIHIWYTGLLAEVDHQAQTQALTEIAEIRAMSVGCRQCAEASIGDEQPSCLRRVKLRDLLGAMQFNGNVCQKYRFYDGRLTGCGPGELRVAG